MDLAFFGLQEPPFNPAPNPRFLYLTPVHQEALAQLLYGVQNHKGFMLLTGEVGTGKTILLKALLEQLDESTAVAFVTNPFLDFEGLLEYVLEDLGIAKPGQSLAQRLVALQTFLIERQRAGQGTVLVIDEAHDLAPETLERIRLLSNFETTNDKILQIVLAGQPELRAKLELPELRQLKQRIGLRCRLAPLQPEQVGDYIRCRLRVAGCRDLGLFSRDAIGDIARYTAGVPRVINTICDHCLLFAYTDQVRRIGTDVVKAAIEYLEDAGEPEEQARAGAGRLHARRLPMTPLRWAFVTASVLAAGAAALGATHPDLASRALDFGSDIAHSVRSLMPL